jgi:hypothetical protein
MFVRLFLELKRWFTLEVVFSRRHYKRDDDED